MTLYLYKCECGREQEEFQDKDAPRECKCGRCGKDMKQTWRSLAITSGFTDGFDPGLGEYFNTQRERDYFVDSNNLRRVKS